MRWLWVAWTVAACHSGGQAARDGGGAGAGAACGNADAAASDGGPIDAGAGDAQQLASPCPAGRPALDQWSAMSAAGAPAARALHVAVWTGSELVVWGGRTPGGALGDGARWSPATDRWIAMQRDASTPSARWDHIGLWTGSELVVWGGRNDVTAGLLGDGGRWDPLTDRWRVMVASPDQPAPRARPAHAWTGSELVVFGGVGAGIGGNVEGGARWSPASERWRALSGTGAPPGGAGRAVFTGSEVIVATSQAARWDARSDLWRPLSPGFPTFAAGYSLVWTGREVLLWGGQQGGRPSSAGGRYDPVSDRWSPFLASGAPSGRSEQGSAWTGSELLVWGGEVGDLLGAPPGLGDGGRWIQRDAWLPMSATGAPSPRWGHSAVWTGSELLIWGGVGDATERGARWR